MTIVLTSHDMDEAEQLCDHIAIMDHGRILVLDASRASRLLNATGRL
jgi:ABC-type multidrug transport system ATPase subunit